jgi:sec-independent protein translocase protein TatC
MAKLLKNIWRFITAPFRFIYWFFRGIFRWFSGKFKEIRSFFTEEVEDSPVTDAVSKAVEHPQELLVHLDALRKHLLRSIAAIALATALSFTFNHQILEFLSRPLAGGMESLIAIEVTEPIGTVMRVSLLSGFAVAFPYVALELWMFIAPGLSRKSRFYGLLAIPIATVFFIGGMAFAYFVMLPAALPFLLNFMGIATIPRPSSYIKFVTGIMFWLGVAFEFPLVIYLLARLGLVRAEMLQQQWRLAIVIIAVVAAVITPTVDPVNMSLVMGPMIVLYFLSIVLAKIAQRGRAREALRQSQAS